jgi:hypothetical protein
VEVLSSEQSAISKINWVSRIEEQRKIIKNKEEMNQKQQFVHAHVYA